MAGVGSIAAIGAADDPRIDPNGLDQTTYPTRVLNKLHDTSISIEEYLFHAKQTRLEEDRLYGPGSDFQAAPGPVTSFIKRKVLRQRVEERVVLQPRLSISAQGEGQVRPPSDEFSDEKKKIRDDEVGPIMARKKFAAMPISDDEWVQASRAARTATW